jgi:hypothetical protein
VELRSQRRKAPVRFAGGDDPIEFLRAASRGKERLSRGAGAKREFIFFVSGIRKRFDSGAVAKFSARHAEGLINILGRILREPTTALELAMKTEVPLAASIRSRILEGLGRRGEGKSLGLAAQCCDESIQEDIELKARMPDSKKKSAGVRRWLHGRVTGQARRILPKGARVSKRLLRRLAGC